MAARASHSSADPHYIENLTFFDRCPDSPRANSFKPAPQFDASDQSIGLAAGSEGGFNSRQKQFDRSRTFADVLFSTTLTAVVGKSGETISLDDQGQGLEGARSIQLTAGGFLHVRDIRANAVSIPEPPTARLLSLTFFGFCLLHRPEPSMVLPQIAR